MDTEDLREKLRQVCEAGGIPVYIVATTGTTDAIGIDDVSAVRRAAEETAKSFEYAGSAYPRRFRPGRIFCLF